MIRGDQKFTHGFAHLTGMQVAPAEHLPTPTKRGIATLASLPSDTPRVARRQWVEVTLVLGLCLTQFFTCAPFPPPGAPNLGNQHDDFVRRAAASP